MSSNTRTASPGFTPQQKQAVDTRHVSVSLSAGAGCGKTFVLTERYLSHLDPQSSGALTPEQIGQLVAITFTDRAAREMRDRIRKRCYERLQAASAADASYWSALLRALDNARISTIHAFCASLLRSRAVEAGLDPQFAVLEQAQADTLLSEAVDDEMRRLVSERDESTLQLAVQFGLDGLRAMVRQLVLETTPQLLERWQNVTPEELVATWVEFFASLQPRLAAEIAQSEPARSVLEVLRNHEPSHAVMRERREVLLRELSVLEQGLPGDASLGAVLESINTNARVVGGGNGKAWPTAEIYQTFRDAAAELRDLVKGLSGVAAFDPTDAQTAAELGLQLLSLAAGVYGVYAQRKAELRVLDFSDLLVRARALLVDKQSDVAQQLGERITLLLVDEFQDTDPLQVELVVALCGKGLEAGKLFFVGDYKQSIYRFRGADPHVFRALRDRTPSDGQQALSLNFRSQPAILNFVNALFWNDLGAGYEPLEAHRTQVSPQPAVEFLWAAAPHGDRESVEQLRRREADWVAARLRELLDGGEPIVWDGEAAKRGSPAARPARNGDIAILLRALTNVEAYESALRRYDIDYYLVGGHAFYAQQEIFDLLNLLRTLNSTVDLVSLVGTLRSPFFSLTDETIYWLAQQPGGLGAGVFAGGAAEMLTSEQRRQVDFAGRTLKQLRACKDRLRISELIEMALELTGYDAVLLHEFLGERKLANLLKLVEQARGFQRGDFLGLADFIARLAEFVVRQPDEPLAATHSEDTNVVRLMSVHQSKGLEFPIVVVPDLNRVPHGGAGRVHFDARLGPLARPLATDDEPRSVSGYDLWRFAEKAEEAAEMNRLLYVATTRAADYLILSTGVQTLGEAKSPWMQLLDRRFDLTTGRFLCELPAGQELPQVKVTTEPPSAKAVSARGPRPDIAALATRIESIPRSDKAVRASVDPLTADLAARRQFSFSRLSGALHRKYERLDEAAAGMSGSPDPRGLGTLVHAALAALSSNEAVDIRELVEHFAEQHLPDASAEVAEAAAMIERFAASPRARHIAAAQASHAEVEFLLAWPAAGAAAGSIALRGYLDRLYQDAEGRWHVLDFKTNRIGPRGVASVAAAYEMQMYVYALATERILKSSPASLTLHFLRTGEEYTFAWDDAARSRVERMVSDAMAVATAQPEETLATSD